MRVAAWLAGLLILTEVFSTLPAQARGRENSPLAIGATFFMENLLNTSGLHTGGKALVGNVRPLLTVQGFIGGGDLRLVTSASYSMFPSSGADNAVLERLLVLDLQGSFQLSERMDFHLGAGNLFHFISGAGGGIVLNNGESFETFFAPAFDSTVRLFHLRAGLGFHLFSHSRIDLDAIMTGAFSSDRRAPSLMVGYTVGFL